MKHECRDLVDAEGLCAACRKRKRGAEAVFAIVCMLALAIVMHGLAGQ